MESLLAFLDTYGYWLVLAVGFAEYSGVPIASIPVLIAAGALASAEGLSLPGVAVSAALGGLLADAGWYGLARWKGQGLVGVACGLSSNRAACVLGVQQRVTRVGSRYILFAKFIPGAGNLVAAAAGFGGFPMGRFLILDAAALALWSSAYSGLGWLFSSQTGAAIEIAVAYSRWVIGAAILLIAVFSVRRVIKAVRHSRMHAAV